MKQASQVVAALLWLIISSVAQPSGSLDDILKLNAGGDGAVKILIEMTADQQREQLDLVARNVQKIINGPRPFSGDAIVYLSNAAYLLAECGSDNAILKGFGDLLKFDSATERDAIHALSACRGPDGISIMKALAEERLTGLAHAIDPVTEEERKSSNRIMLQFISLVNGIYRSVNPNGKETARHIRDDFSSRYQSQNGQHILAAIDLEFAKEKPARRKSKIYANSSDSSKNSNRDASTPQILDVSSHKTEPLKFWLIVLAVTASIIGLVCLTINRRKRPI
jgi:hypothetical protein